jgi:hypothetical protein
MPSTRSYSEKEKKRKEEGEKDKEEAQDDGNKDEGLCVGCKQSMSSVDIKQRAKRLAQIAGMFCFFPI